MGQYYLPIILSPDPEAKNADGLPLILGYFLSFDFGNGLKLMEHSYLGNNFVDYVVSQLMPGAPFHKCRVVWQGDYANPEPDVNIQLHGYCNEHEELHIRPEKRVSASTVPGANFLVNYSKSQYVDFSHITDTDIHPLPLLTWETHGGGGGDFRGSDPQGLCSSWARDVIGAEAELPAGQGWTEIIFDLKE
jgi:hypothetical protein